MFSFTCCAVKLCSGSSELYGVLHCDLKKSFEMHLHYTLSKERPSMDLRHSKKTQRNRTQGILFIYVLKKEKIKIIPTLLKAFLYCLQLDNSKLYLYFSSSQISLFLFSSQPQRICFQAP